MHRPILATLIILTACGASSSDDTSSSTTTPETTAAETTTPTTTDAGTTAAVSTTAEPGTSTGEPGTSTGDVDPCTASPQALADCVEDARWQDDIGFIADIRTPGSPHWQAVQDLCADRLTEYGYEVALQAYATGVNVVGRKLGAGKPDEQILVGAHYDHIAGCRGADDNASGVAATLEVARVLALAEFDRTVLVACWDEEEEGLVGSEAYVAAATTAGDNIVGYFNYEMIGYYSDEPGSQEFPAGFELAFPDAQAQLAADEFRGNFITVVSDSDSHDHVVAYAAAAERIGLKAIALELPAGTETTEVFADLRRSDHASFWDAGYPALFLTDSAEFRNQHYHCTGGPDEVADLTPTFAVAVTRATVEAAAVALGL